MFSIGCEPGDTAIGDKVQLEGGELSNPISTVSQVGEDYIEITNTGDYYSGVPTAFHNLTKLYTATDWAGEDEHLYKFGARAKDSASPTENLTKIGVLVEVEAPTEWIYDIVEAMGGIEF